MTDNDSLVRVDLKEAVQQLEEKKDVTETEVAHRVRSICGDGNDIWILSMDDTVYKLSKPARVSKLPVACVWSTIGKHGTSLVACGMIPKKEYVFVSIDCVGLGMQTVRIETTYKDTPVMHVRFVSLHQHTFMVAARSHMYFDVFELDNNELTVVKSNVAVTGDTIASIAAVGTRDDSLIACGMKQVGDDWTAFINSIRIKVKQDK